MNYSKKVVSNTFSGLNVVNGCVKNELVCFSTKRYTTKFSVQKDILPNKRICVKEDSGVSNNLQLIFLKMLNMKG